LGRYREICPIIFGIKIIRLDFFVTFFIKEKRKDLIPPIAILLKINQEQHPILNKNPFFISQLVNNL
jgi:hypothetical protein